MHCISYYAIHANLVLYCIMASEVQSDYQVEKQINIPKQFKPQFLYGQAE